MIVKTDVKTDGSFAALIISKKYLVGAE